ncbi:MAG: hypothetical protein O9272_13445 [Brevundimonas sp.]|jgi:hypothetical protein|nr:hypothetical protein [Brevundimonas sp.]
MIILALAAAASAITLPPPNPFLSQGAPAVTHNDSGASDAMAVEGPREQGQVAPERVKRIPTGLLTINYAGLLHYPGGVQATWNTNNNRVTKIRIDNGHWEELAALPIEGMTLLSAETVNAHLAAFDRAASEAELRGYLARALPFYAETQAREAGIYSMTDERGQFYVLTRSAILVYGQADDRDPRSAVVLLRKWTIPAALKREEAARALLLARLERSGQGTNAELRRGIGMMRDMPLGINMTYDGHIVFSMVGGSVVVIDREFRNAPQVVTAPGELFTNSLSVDPDGGIYAVGDRRMHKFVWRRGKLSDRPRDGAWSSPYDLTESPLPGVRGGGTGSGTTATLMGFGPGEDRLVVISDGQQRMNIVAFWRDAIPRDARRQPGTRSRRIAGQMAVTMGGIADPYIQTEASIGVAGPYAFVLNGMAPQNIKPDLDNLLVQGPFRTPPRGVEMFRWDHARNRWQSLWARADVSTPAAIIPVLSTVSRQAYVMAWDSDGWNVTGLDFDSGKTETRMVLGRSQQFNGAWGVLQLLPDGDVFIPGITGPVRVSRKRH